MPQRIVAYFDEKTWHERVQKRSKVLMLLHEPFSTMVETLDQGLEHAGLQLEFIPRPRNKRIDPKDEERIVRPGDTNFASYFDRKVQDFHRHRDIALSEWSRANEVFKARNIQTVETGSNESHGEQEEMYIILYMEELIYDMSLAIYALVLFADRKSWRWNNEEVPAHIPKLSSPRRLDQKHVE